LDSEPCGRGGAEEVAGRQVSPSTADPALSEAAKIPSQEVVE